MKVGIRLLELEQMITGSYQHIWDCCCDHGLLGLMLLQRNAATKIHFVDIVEALTLELNTKLERFFSNDKFINRWQVHCLDAGKIPLSADIHKQPQCSDLVIIAGVGGDRVIELVNQILTRYPDREIEFLLSPVHHNYKVRQTLINNKMGLINEKLICENNRFYELIHVSTKSLTPVSVIGSLIWDFTQPNVQTYFDKTIAHYQCQAKDPKKSVHHILEAYKALKK